MRNNKWMIGALAMLLVTVAFTPAVMAAPITLTDENSSVVLDPNSQSGMSDWLVDGVDQLYQQWFWFRVGNTAAEQSLDALTVGAPVVIDTDLDGDNDLASVTFIGTGFTINITYLLRGGQAGSGASDVAETIVINNTGTSSLDFHFFQYSDFDLNGTSDDDRATLLNDHAVLQRDASGPVLTETVVTPSPAHWEIAEYSDTLDSLTDGSATTLSDATSPLGPDDVTWAFQWDRTIARGGTFIISKDKNIAKIPAPGAALLGLVGLGLVGWVRRRMA